MVSPIVSVCIPAYNMARYLPITIESVLAQDFQDYELVIYDDASTDSTPDICRSYVDPRVRYVRTAGKSGQAGAFNRCLENARGEFITILHHDDYFLPGFLNDRVARLQSSPQFDFVFGAVQTVDANGALLSTTGRWTEDKVFAPGELLEPMLHSCILCPPSLMIRRSCLPKVGLFRTDFTWGLDWEWDIRLAEYCGGCFVAKALAAYRAHDLSGTAEQLAAANNGPQERRILMETFARLCTANPSIGKLKKPVFRGLSRRHMYFAEQATLEGRRSVARSNLWYAMAADWGLLFKPTYWALLAGAVGPRSGYELYKKLRGSVGR